MDETKIEEIRRSSDVFFGLWYYRMTHGDPLSAEMFTICARTWTKIQRMEAEEDAKGLDEVFRSWSVPAEPVLQPIMAEPEAAPPAEAPKAKISGPYSSFKNEILTRLEAARAAGVTIAQIAEASGGKLTPDNVLDLLGRKRRAMEMWDACDRALKALGWEAKT